VALVTGLSKEHVDGLIADVEAAAQASLRLAVRRVQAHISQVVTAAGEPVTPGIVSVDDLGLIQSTWVTQVDDVLSPMLSSAFGQGADAIAVGIGKEFGFAVPQVSSALAEQHLADAVNRMKNTGNTVWEQARNDLLDGVKAGESIDQLSTRLENTLSTTEADATRVARTEVISATNAGSYAMAQTTGLDMEKQWIATEDTRTRLTHREADGQLQPLSQPFEVGGSQLQYPGDPTGPADEVINCRCTQGYEIPADQPLLNEPAADLSLPSSSSDTGLFDQAGNTLSEQDLETLSKKSVPTSKDLVYDSSGKLVEDHPVNLKSAENKAKAKAKLAEKKAAASAPVTPPPVMAEPVNAVSDVDTVLAYQDIGGSTVKAFYDQVEFLLKDGASLEDAYGDTLLKLAKIPTKAIKKLMKLSEEQRLKLLDHVAQLNGKPAHFLKDYEDELAAVKPLPAASVSLVDADLSMIPAAVKSSLHQVWGYTNFNVLTPPETLWEGFSTLSETAKSVYGVDLSPLDIMRLVDEQNAETMGLPNLKGYEHKVVDWMKTSDGQDYLANGKSVAKPAAKATKTATPTVSKPKIPTAVAKPVNFELPELQYDLTDAADSAYTNIDAFTAQKVQDAAVPWTPGQQSALRYYTSNNYHEMNGFLRKDEYASDTAKKKIMDAQAGMRPSTQPMTLYRGTNPSQFGLGRDAGLSDLEKLVGKDMQDKGFMSTSVGNGAAFGGKVLLQIEAPAGSQMAFVKSISHYSGENEMLLAAGTRYKVMSVVQRGGQIVVRVRIIP
jgi:hypothetical protein